jgi:hypothetical protein
MLLEQSECDVLILLDCCASGTANSGEGNGASELISACAYNATANGVGPYSFTSALVIELTELSKKHSFSVGELYSNIFIRTQCRLPEDGRERHPAPVHLVLTRSTQFPRSIQLSRMGIRAKNDSTTLPSSLLAALATQSTARGSNSSCVVEIDNTISSMPSITREEMNRLNSNSAPRLAFAVRLNESFETGDLSIDAFVEWLRTVPALVDDVKIEAGFESFSSLLIISLPIAICSYLPRNPAIFSLGPIRSSDKVAQHSDDTNSSKTSIKLETTCPRKAENEKEILSIFRQWKDALTTVIKGVKPPKIWWYPGLAKFANHTRSGTGFEEGYRSILSTMLTTRVLLLTFGLTLLVGRMIYSSYLNGRQARGGEDIRRTVRSVAASCLDWLLRMLQINKL